MEGIARILLFLILAALLVNVMGVGGEGLPSSGSDVSHRIGRWLKAKLVGG